jgi:short subunit dehydrogenase-like uncharacterized protein
MKKRLLIYGANGYTGELAARHAKARGLDPILAGRSQGVLPLAKALSLETRVFSLENGADVDSALTDVQVVLHCAGPFSRTARPMANGCLRTRTHYLDVTGEIEVFEDLASCDESAHRAGVMLLPGVGFDVVPSDGLALHLKERLPSATHLSLAFQGLGQVSRGTATTMLENIDSGGRIRRGGALVWVPSGHAVRTVDLGLGPTKVIAVPWGDVSTAFYSTGIPNIEVFMAAPLAMRLGMMGARWFGPLLSMAWVKGWLKKLVDSSVTGPNEAARSSGRSFLWGEARDDSGAVVSARLETPEAYELTKLAAVAIAERVLAGDVHVGFQTPARAYGADFILSLPGIVRTDL